MKKSAVEKLKLPHPTYTFSGNQMTEVMNEIEIYWLPIFLYDDTPDSLGWKLVEEFKGESDQVLFRGYRTRDNTYIPMLGKELGKSYTYSTVPKTAASEKQGRRAFMWWQLSELCRCASACEPPGDHDLILKIGRVAISLVTLDRLEVGRARDPVLEAKERGAAYQSGLMKGLAAWGKIRRKGRIPKTGKAGIALESITIMRAAAFVRCFEKLPTKTWLRAQLENEGYKYAETKGQAASKWKDLFNKSGLDSLPE